MNIVQSRVIEIAHSPDADDLMMFWALRKRYLKHADFDFRFTTADTQALNQKAESADCRYHVIAVSIFQYAFLAKRYWLLRHGGSVGNGYGPVLVSAHPTELRALEGERIAIPGERTTAALTLRLLLDSFIPVTVPIVPFSAVFDAVASSRVSAALIIHEGRLLYEQYKMHKVVELGEAWHALTQQSLPLGGNLIQKNLSYAVALEISNVLEASIRWALEHRDQVLDEMLNEPGCIKSGMSRTQLDQYLSMYANQDTLAWGANGQKAIETLFERAYEKGLIDKVPRVEMI